MLGTQSGHTRFADLVGHSAGDHPQTNRKDLIWNHNFHQLQAAFVWLRLQPQSSKSRSTVKGVPGSKTQDNCLNLMQTVQGSRVEASHRL